VLDWRCRSDEYEPVHPQWSVEVCCLSMLVRRTQLMERFGNRYGVDMKLEDSLAASLVDQNPGGTKTPMGSEPIPFPIELS